MKTLKWSKRRESLIYTKYYTSVQKLFFPFLVLCFLVSFSLCFFSLFYCFVYGEGWSKLSVENFTRYGEGGTKLSLILRGRIWRGLLLGLILQVIQMMSAWSHLFASQQKKKQDTRKGYAALRCAIVTDVTCRAKSKKKSILLKTMPSYVII